MSDQNFSSNFSNKPSKSMKRVLKQAEKDIAKGENLSPLFIDMKKMDCYLAHL